MEAQEEHSGEIGIMDLPEEVMEYILSLLSPYSEFQAARLVCKRWHAIMKGVTQQCHSSFLRAVSEGTVEWSCLRLEYGSTITERYSHSACYHDKSVYIFGGCTSTSTTFNDLWRFDLASRQWIRPLALGTYPSPKACASLVSYNDTLILFGGWSHPTPYPLHQAAHFFNELNTYCPKTNMWSFFMVRMKGNTHNAMPGLAGHAACILGNSMIVFGGSRGHGASCNDIWILDIDQMAWTLAEVTGRKPMPRYGHSQIVLDDTHIIVVGGCGGPNMQFNDIWLLTRLDENSWSWHELLIHGQEYSPPHLWFHPSCKVGDRVIVLSKLSPRSPRTPTPPGGQGHLNLSKVWVPPRDKPHPGRSNSHPEPPQKGQSKRRLPQPSDSSSQESSSDGEEKGAIGGRSRKNGNHGHGAGGPQQSTSRGGNETTQANLKGCSGGRSVGPSASLATSSDSRAMRPNTLDTGKSGVAHTGPVRAGMPAVRPNAMKNRLKQLEALKRFEDRIMSKMNVVIRENGNPGPSASASSPQEGAQRTLQNHMFIHALDITTAISDGFVTWQAVGDEFTGCPPEETIFYSLVCGRAELIMFGGIQTDLNTMQWGISRSQVATNNLHFISAQQTLW